MKLYAISANRQAKWEPLLLSENSEKKDPVLTKALCEHLPKKYKDELKLTAQEKRAPKGKMEILERGSPLLFRKVDEMVRSYILGAWFLDL